MARSKETRKLKIDDLLSSDEDIEHVEGNGHLKGSMQDYFSDLSGEAFQNLSKSDYAKVIFCDLYYNTDSTVGCRFQITDNVHEDPCDYIGLYKVGYDSLAQCLASKLLSNTECEDDGKLLRCTFKPTELPELEQGFYQFLYVTRDEEVCGASMPFEIKNAIFKDISSDEDIVADKTEDDFLVVRSNAAEKNRRLQSLLDEMNEKCLSHEGEMKKIQAKVRIINEEKLQLESLLRKACEENNHLLEATRNLTEERDTISSEKEEAIRILKEKNTVLSTIFDDFTCKLKGFTELKDTLEADKNFALAENNNLQERMKKLTEDLQNKQKIFEEEKEKYHEMACNLKKENSSLNSQLDDFRLMIEALEKSKQLTMTDLSGLSSQITELKEKFKEIKCENFALKSKLHDTTKALKEKILQIHDMKSEIAALQLHIIEIEESRPSVIESQVSSSKKGSNSSSNNVPIIVEEKCKVSVQEESVQTSADRLAEYKDVCDKLGFDLDKKYFEIIQNCRQAFANNTAGLHECMDMVKELSSELEKKNAAILQESVQTSADTSAELQVCKDICDKLTSELEEKNAAILQLKEELVKSNAVVEYLTKERDSVQKSGSRTQEALNECVLRLNEASEIYKKQYRKIEKLKKRLKKSKSNLSEDLSSEVSSVKANSAPDVTVEAAVEKSDLSQAQSSDSDTGEHVSRYPFSLLKEENFASYMASGSASSSSQRFSTPKDVPKMKEIPELQTMIEKNLEKLSSSKSKDEDILYAIPCPVCDQDVGIYMSCTDEMVKHLETQHKQQLCPICGRLFDMTLPSKYFQFHVEDHFKRGDK